MKKWLCLAMAAMMVTLSAVTLADNEPVATSTDVEAVEAEIETNDPAGEMTEALESAPVEEAAAEETVVEEPVAEESAAEENIPAEEPEAEEAPAVERSVRIVCKNSEINMGDEVTLKAKLIGFDDVEVTIIWQYMDKDNVPEDEEPTWQTAQIGGTKLTFTMTESMKNVDWRVVVETAD